MRTFCTLALLLGATTVACAQNLVGYPASFSLELGEIVDYGEYTLENIGTEPIEVALELDVACYDPDDELMLQLDLGFDHWPPRNTDGIFDSFGNALLTLDPGETYGLFYAGQWEVGTYGSEWRIYHYDRNNPEDRVLLTIYVDSCDPANGVEEVPQLAATPAYPNPAQNTVNIDFETAAFPVQLEVCDALGQVVKDLTIDSPQASVAVDVSDLSNGVYTYFLSADGYRSHAAPLVIAR